MLLILHFVLIGFAVSKEISNESEEDSYEDINWQCGTDEFTKYISENQIEIDCPKLKVTINDCCLTHDACYDNQLGRKFCDDTFCQCLDEATRSSVICNKEDGPLFCGLVREFGEDAYLRSGNATEEEGSGQQDLLSEVANDTLTMSEEGLLYGKSEVGLPVEKLPPIQHIIDDVLDEQDSYSG